MSRGLILVVDDDDDFSAILSEIISLEGFVVAQARNGREALQWLRQGNSPNLIFLDLMMPVMDGYTFRALQLRDAALRAIPVVVLTAGTIDDRARALSTDCFEKPAPIRQLLAVIHRRIEAHPEENRADG